MAQDHMADPFQPHRCMPPGAADGAAVAHLRYHHRWGYFKLGYSCWFGLWTIVRLQRAFRTRQFLRWVRAVQQWKGWARLCRPLGIAFAKTALHSYLDRVVAFLWQPWQHATHTPSQPRSPTVFAIKQLQWVALSPRIFIWFPAQRLGPRQLFRFLGSHALQGDESLSPQFAATYERTLNGVISEITTYLPMRYFGSYPHFVPAGFVPRRTDLEDFQLVRTPSLMIQGGRARRQLRQPPT